MPVSLLTIVGDGMADGTTGTSDGTGGTVDGTGGTADGTGGTADETGERGGCLYVWKSKLFLTHAHRHGHTSIHAQSWATYQIVLCI